MPSKKLTVDAVSWICEGEGVDQATIEEHHGRVSLEIGDVDVILTPGQAEALGDALSNKAIAARKEGNRGNR